VATVLVYLSDAEEGGETVFLLEGREGLDRLAHIDYKACDTGIRVRAALPHGWMVGVAWVAGVMGGCVRS
jgi:hypothetical protein